MARSKTQAQQLEEAAVVMQLHSQGMTEREIVAHLKSRHDFRKATNPHLDLPDPPSQSTVHRRITLALQSIVLPDIETARAMELSRYQELWNALQPAVARGDVQAIGEARKLSESMRKMLGLDQPAETKTTVEVGPTPALAARLDEIKRQAQLEQMRRLELEEANTIEAEVLDG